MKYITSPSQPLLLAQVWSFRRHLLSQHPFFATSFFLEINAILIKFFLLDSPPLALILS